MALRWLRAAALALAALLAGGGAALGQGGPGEEELVRLRAQLEALRRQVDEVRTDLGVAKEKLARIDAERAALAVPGAATAGGRIPANARVAYILEGALPRLGPGGASGATRFATERAGFASVVSAVAEPLRDVILAVSRAPGIAAVGAGTFTVFAESGKPVDIIAVAAFELEPPVSARRGWPWAAVRRIEPYQWALFGERSVVLVAGGLGKSAVGSQVTQALEQAAAPIPLVHASDYPAIFIEAARGDLLGSPGPSGFAVQRGPRAEGFFADVLGEKLDIRAGDVITSVNGVAIGADATAAGLLARLRDERRFEIALLRGDRPIRLTVEVRGGGEADVREERALPRHEQLEREVRAGSLMDDLEKAIEARDAPRVVALWLALEKPLADERKMDDPRALAAIRDVGRRRDGQLRRARELLREGFLGEGRKVIAAMAAALERKEFREALAGFERLEGLAARMEAIDGALAPAAGELRAAARPILERARIDRDIRALRIALTPGSVTLGGVPKAVVNGRPVGEGDPVADADGAPIPGLKVARIKAGRVVLAYEGVEFEPAAEPAPPPPPPGGDGAR